MALLELYTRQAIAERSAARSYSRFQWNHPGPRCSTCYGRSTSCRAAASRACASRAAPESLCLAALLAIVWRRAGQPPLPLAIALGLYLFRVLTSWSALESASAAAAPGRALPGLGGGPRRRRALHRRCSGSRVVSRPGAPVGDADRGRADRGGAGLGPVRWAPAIAKPMDQRRGVGGRADVVSSACGGSHVAFGQSLGDPRFVLRRPGAGPGSRESSAAFFRCCRPHAPRIRHGMGDYPWDGHLCQLRASAGLCWRSR